jgi:hypothetical protein
MFKAMANAAKIAISAIDWAFIRNLFHYPALDYLIFDLSFLTTLVMYSADQTSVELHILHNYYNMKSFFRLLEKINSRLNNLT